MDSFEFNKAAGAVLGTALFIMIAGTLSESLFETEAPETPVYLANLATAEGGDHGAAGGQAAPQESIAMLLPSADAGAGENVAKKCAACHTFEKGGANKVGPHLWDIVNRPIASVSDYSYSDAMKAFADGGKDWTYENLDHFIAKPKALVSGTKMGFGGLSKASDRADLIAYLRTLADNPAPLPEAPAAGSSAEAGGAAGGTASTETAAAEPMQQTATDASGDAAMTPQADTGETAAAMPEKPADAAASETPASGTAASEAPAGETAAGGTSASESATTEMAAAGSDTSNAAASGSGSDNPVLAMIASEDPAAGEKVAKKCQACHTFDEGGKAKVGPPLWNIVNRPVASVEGFNYSDAMKKHADGGTVWSYEHLDAYLTKPKDVVPGTKMVFAGLRKESDRAALLAYLRTLSNDPAPLP